MSSETSINDRNDGGGAKTTATMWITTNDEADAIFMACQGTSKQQCYADAWNILQSIFPSMNQENFDEECVHRMAAATSIISNNDVYALFVSSDEGAKRLTQDENTLKWKHYMNGEWKRGNAMLHPLSVDTHDATGLPSNSTFSASLDSTLSSSGGMHRLLQHELSITCPPNTPDGTLYQATLDMMVYVTHHFFVDVDDALELLENTTLASLHDTTTTLRIDIEQPAFGSPHHVLNIQVQVEGHCQDAETNAPHKFATKLHTRYPPLTNSGDLHVAFPAPLILNGTLALQGESYSLTHNDITWQAPIVTHVATGYTEDVVWVPMATILISLVGSWCILRSMARVSKWN